MSGPGEAEPEETKDAFRRCWSPSASGGTRESLLPKGKRRDPGVASVPEEPREEAERSPMAVIIRLNL